MTARSERVRSRLAELGVDALLVTSPPNVRHLSGFSGSNAQLLVAAEDVLLTDPRYEEQAARESPSWRREIYQGSGMIASIASAMSALGARRVGFEAEHVSVATAGKIRDALAGAEMVETSGVAEDLRRVKDETEVAALRRACAIADAALPVLLGELREGLSEREAAAILEDAMRRGGSDGASFETIMAFGENAAEPHHRAGDRTLRRGDVVKVDFGAIADGYHSDMTRTVAFGTPPEELARVHDLVRRAQAAGVEAVRAGTTCKDVDAATRALLAENGLDYGHGTGHGFGLEVHEAPTVRRESADILAAGMTVTVEPGVYLPGIGGVRIEDSVVVRDGGCEILTRSPKELIVV